MLTTWNYIWLLLTKWPQEQTDGALFCIMPNGNILVQFSSYIHIKAHSTTADAGRTKRDWSLNTVFNFFLAFALFGPVFLWLKIKGRTVSGILNEAKMDILLSAYYFINDLYISDLLNTIPSTLKILLV